MNSLGCQMRDVECGWRMADCRFFWEGKFFQWIRSL